MSTKIAQFKVRKGSSASAYEYRKVQDDYTAGLEWVSEYAFEKWNAELPAGWFINPAQIVMAPAAMTSDKQAQEMVLSSSPFGDFYTMSVNDAVQAGFIIRV